MTAHSWTFFVTTVFIASIIPGPSMLLALTHGIKYGTKPTLFSALGNVSATIIQAILSIAGLGVILTTSGFAFTIIKWFGAIYLIYLGIKSWRSRETTFNIKHSPKTKQILPASKLFSQAFILTLGNPKAILFFTALFPQFIHKDMVVISSIVPIITVLAIIAFICWMLYAICGNKIVAFLNRSIIGEYFNQIIGGTFIGIGISVAASER